MYTIGVFDSGKGGLSVANAIQKARMDDKVLFVDDSKHLPYGSKPPKELLGFVIPILNELVSSGCDVIVIACNTVTTTLIAQLREVISVPLVGIEPMVKPAALQTKSGVIAVCATPTTLTSDRYGWLKKTYGSDVIILEPDCSEWATMIEQNTVDRQKVIAEIERCCVQGADVIVLACTHYHWIEELIIQAVAGRTVVLQPEQAIIDQLSRVVSTLGK